MAETEQRFDLHAQSRNVARIIGYPAGLGILAAAVFFPFGDTQERWVGGVLCPHFSQMPRCSEIDAKSSAPQNWQALEVMLRVLLTPLRAAPLPRRRGPQAPPG